MKLARTDFDALKSRNVRSGATKCAEEWEEGESAQPNFYLFLRHCRSDILIHKRRVATGKLFCIAPKIKAEKMWRSNIVNPLLVQFLSSSFVYT